MLNPKNDQIIDFDKSFKTLSEKINVLQARDKFIRSHKEKQTDIEKAEAVLGSCNDMCPEYERYCREDRNLLSPLEMTNGLPDEYKMIKEYVRSGADQEEPLPHELRPSAVLERTMLYLCSNIMDIIDTENNISADWFDFLWSRTRAIRKDITQQHLCGIESVKLMEVCARFHIYCAHRLCEEDISIFDPKINNENLTKCIQSLKDFYYDLNLKNIQCQNETEFRCYDILLNLHDGDVLREVSQLKQSIRDSSYVKFAIQVYLAYNNKNFVRFFIYLKDASYLSACIMHRYFTPIRLQALHLLKKAFVKSSQKEYFFKNHLIEQLLFDDEQSLIDFCNELKLPIEEDYVVIIRSDTSLPSGYKEKRSLVYIENKKNGKSIGEIVYGEPIKQNSYKKYPLTYSFHKNGLFNDENIRNQMKKLKNEMKSNQLITKNETQNTKSLNLFKSQNINQSQNNQALVDDKSKFIFGNNFTSQKLSSNIFQKTFENVINHNNQIDANQDLFGKKTNSNFSSLFSKQNQNVFGYTESKNLFGNDLLNYSNNQKSETNNSSNSFHFKLPKKSNEICSDIQEIFKSEDSIFNKLKEKSSLKMIEKKLINKNDISSIAANIFQKILNELIIKLIKRSYIEIIATNYSLEVVNALFNEVVSNLIHDLCNSVYSYELKKYQHSIRLIGITSKFTCDKLIDEYLDEIIKITIIPLYKQKLDCLIYNQSEETNEYILNETIDEIVKSICTKTYTDLLEQQRLIVTFIKEKRSKRLARNYFNYWKSRCDYLKRYRYIKATFPASKLENKIPLIKKMKFEPCKKIDKRKLSLPDLNNEQENSELNRCKIFKFDSDCENFNLSVNDLFLLKLKEKIKKDNTTKSKLDYARRSLSNLCKISKTFNTSLAMIKPYLNKYKEC